MDLEWSERDRAFQDEVRAFLDDKLTPDLRRAGRLMTSVYADHEASMAWQAILHERGWAAPAWPVEHGGCDWSLTQHYIFSRESTLAGAPALSPMGIKMVAHAIIRFGTEEQKDFFLPRILTGEVFFCQGYSEPESGSDLASLQMAAVSDDGRDLVCTGSKIWTTHATEANWMFALVRTSRIERKQQGITFVLIDMTTPGIEIHPLVMTSGEEVQNQVFFSGVRVPKANVLGEIDDGWTVAKYLLEFERGGGAIAPALQVMAEEIATAAAAQPGPEGRSTDRRPGVRPQARRRPHPHRGPRDPGVPHAGRRGRGRQPGPGVVDAQGAVHRAEPGHHRAGAGNRGSARPGVPATRHRARRPGHRIRPARGRVRQRRTVAGGGAAAVLQRPRRLDLRRQQRDSAQHPRQSSARTIGTPMDFNLTKEQELLRDGLGKFLGTRYDLAKSRTAAKTGPGWQPDIWRAFADELGILGATLPEEVGGIGGGPVELMVITEALGHALVVEPYVGTVVVCGGLLHRADTAVSPRRCWSRSPKATAVVALADTGDGTTTAERDGDGWVLSGAKIVVLDAPLATHLLITAQTDRTGSRCSSPSSTPPPRRRG